jgi:hypothetical protein
MQKLQARNSYLLKLSQIILHDITTQMAITWDFYSNERKFVTGPW